MMSESQLTKTWSRKSGIHDTIKANSTQNIPSGLKLQQCAMNEAWSHILNNGKKIRGFVPNL